VAVDNLNLKIYSQ